MPMGTQILMIKKAVTYHFCEFVEGRYSKNNEKHLLKLFNNMTYYEKMDILSLNFNLMWYRAYAEDPLIKYVYENNSKRQRDYYKKKSFFETSFMKNGGQLLRKLMSKSMTVDTQWEFPKGRKNLNGAKFEGHVETAIREFCEETGVNDTSFRILWHIKPYVLTYTDFKVTYHNTYYYAEAVGIWEPVYRFYNKHQFGEVATVRWIFKTDLKHMKLEELTYKRLINSFNKILKKYKRYIKTDTAPIEKNDAPVINYV